MPTDFFPLLSRTIQGLDSNTPEHRQAVYDRARQLVERNLRAQTPPSSEHEIVAERRALEDAIWRIEMDSPAESPTPIRHTLNPTNASSRNDLQFQNMKYIRRILQPGERVLARGRYHWIIYVPAIFLLMLSLLVFMLVPKGAPRNEELGWIGAALVLLLLAVRGGLSAWFKQWISKIAVTNFRIVRKSGFIRRQTWEMNMDKVESVTVDQGILGRILGYGTIHVLGTGEGVEHLHQICSPIELRNHIVAR